VREGNLRPGISWRWLVDTVLAPIGRGRQKWDTPMLSTFTLRPSGWTATSGESLPSFSDSMRSKANCGFKRRYQARRIGAEPISPCRAFVAPPPGRSIRTLSYTSVCA